MTTTARAIGVTAAACLLFAAAGHAEDYQVRLERPFKAGDVLQFVAKSGETETQRVSEGDKVLQEKTSTLKAHVEGELEILAVDKKGRKTRVRLTIRKFSGSVDGKAVEPPAAGSVVIAATAGDKTAYELKDGKLPKDIERLFGILIRTHTKSQGDVGDDDVFGTSARKKVGDKWAVNKAAIVKSLKGEGLTIKEGDVNGTVEITELRKVDGVSCLHIEGLVTAANFSPPLPEGAKVLSAKVTTRVIGDFPVDLKLPRLRQGLAVNMAVEIQMPADGEGPAQRMAISSTMWVQQELRPGRKKPKAGVAAIVAKLEKAKTDHAKALATAKEALLKAIDRQIKAATGAGNLEEVTKFQKVKDAVEAKGKFPPGKTDLKLARDRMSFEARVRVANSRLANAYNTAIRECTKAGSLARAEAMQAELEKLGLAAAAGTSYRLGMGMRWPPYLERRSGTYTVVKGGVQSKGRGCIRTKSGEFLDKDFIFDVVFEGAEGHGIAFFGLGEASTGRAYGEPGGSVNLRIHSPGKKYKGAVSLTKSGPFGGKGMGHIPRAGTHRARIHKKGPTVTFSIDVDNDGATADDFSKEIPDIKAFAPFLNEKNFHLFFGGGSKVTYKEVRLVLLH